MQKLALIPARSGSKESKIKTLDYLMVIHSSLTQYRQLFKVKYLMKLYLQLIQKNMQILPDITELQYLFLRAKSISGDKSPDIEWVKFMLKGLSDIGKNFDVFSILRPTSPLRLDSTIKSAFKNFLADKNYDSLRAVEKCNQHPGKMWVNNNNMLFPLIPFKVDGIPWHSSQYSSLPEIYIQNASLEICWTKTIFNMGSISGTKIMPFFTSNYEGFDINNEEDFILAESLIKAKKASTIKIEVPPYQKFCN